MISYSDSETRVFHPICEEALNQAISALGLIGQYEVKHHVYIRRLVMDFAVVEKTTGKCLCVVEVKKTPSNVQSSRKQFQALSYVQENQARNQNLKPYYVITNLEKLISFRYDSKKPSVNQQMLKPGLECICDFSVDNESAITNKVARAFTRLLNNFINDRYEEYTALEDFLVHMKNSISDARSWKSNMAILMYEYLRGAFHAVHKPNPTIKYNVSKFNGDVNKICHEANRVNFDGIFSYSTANFVPFVSQLNPPPSNDLLSQMYYYGEANTSGDAVADALFDLLTENKKYDGEVATDYDLANLVSTAAKMVNGQITNGKMICDPAAGSGSLISSAINVFKVNGSQLMVNDVNPRFIELLSLRLGLYFPKSIDSSNSPKVTANDIVNLNPSDFANVEIVLLNPPFVAGINSVSTKSLFYQKISFLKGTNGITENGQQNLGAVFLELLCCLVPTGTTIACVFPKAQLTERGDEAKAFRRLLLGEFGLRSIFNYPCNGLFESVAEDTCILVGKKASITNTVKVYSSDVPVSDIDLNRLEQYAGAYDNKQFDNITSDIEAREISVFELSASVDNGWRMVSSEMSEAIFYVENNIISNNKIDIITNSTKKYRRGNVGANGGSYLMFLESTPGLYDTYCRMVTFEEGIRDAKHDNIIMASGPSKFLDFNKIGSPLSNRIIVDYTLQVKQAKKQQRKTKTVVEWEKIVKRDGKVYFPANSILIPTKIRKKGRVYVSSVPLYVSTNFVVFSYATLHEAQIIASYMTTVFYQLECEVASKDHAGVRKGELRDTITTHIPKYNSLTQSEINEIIAELPNISFKDLNNPIIAHIDEIWAKILFGRDAATRLNEASRLLMFLANRRNRGNND